MFSRIALAADISIQDEIKFNYGTLHYEIHGHKGREAQMNLVSAIVKSKESIKMLNYFQYAPSTKVHFYLDTRSNIANGSAAPIPYNLIHLYDFPPLDHGSLTISTDWFKILILHELVHIIHMDQTEGFFSFLRTIFGSIIKPGAIVPRWFSEGIAVWAESEFTDFGRLKSKLLEHQLYEKIKSAGKGKFCDNIGCLDSPGDYPFGSYPYWVGSFFMKFLEDLKPGSIRCLIKENANSLPFYLTDSFKACFDSRAEPLFEMFKISFTQKYEEINYGRSKTLIPFYENIDWSKGVGLKHGTLYYVYYFDFEEFIGIHELSNKEFSSLSLKESIQSIDVSDEVYIKTYAGLDERGERKLYKIEWDKLELVSKNIAEYEFNIAGTKVSFHYDKFKWNIKNSNGKEINFPDGGWINFPKKIGNKIVFKYAQSNYKKSYILSLDPNTLRSKTIHSSQEMPFQPVGSCGQDIVMLEGQNLVLESGPAVKHRKVLLATLSRDELFVLKTYGIDFFKDCRDHFKNRLSVEIKKDAPEFKSEELLIEPKETDSYPKLSHFIPRYWFLFFSVTDSTSYTFIRTALSDPRQIHTLNLGVDQYTTINKTAPQVSYTWSPRYFFLGGAYSESFSENSVSSKVSEQKYSSVFVGKQWVGQKWYMTSQFSFLNINEEDFLSERKAELYRSSWLFRYVKPRKHQFLNHFYHKFNVAHFRLDEEFNSHWRYQGAIGFGFNFTNSFRAEFSGAYSRLFKDDLVSGVVYGGGFSSDATESNYHDFHGLTYSSVYGNTLYSFGSQFYYRLFSPYRQRGFIPFQFKEIGPLLGSDYIRGDRVIINAKTKTDTYAHSIFAGFRTKMRLFYLSDLNIDGLFSSATSGEDQEDQILLNFSSEF